MFYHIRYQTGELEDIVKEMKSGSIPCMDVDDNGEFEWFLQQLEKQGIFSIEDMPYDRNARDVIKEPEFEFRVAFSAKKAKASEIPDNEIMYIDFYFEPIEEETYDPIFGD